MLRCCILIAGIVSRLLTNASTLPLHRTNNCTTQQTYPSTCNDKIIRREWNTFTPFEERDFISSIKCMMESPSQLPTGIAPGAMNRYDDFVATHINNTFHVHVSGIFLGFHRRFLQLFETAMREECGYQGYLPYMYWPNYAPNLTNSSIFDGSPLSLGGDGYLNTSNPNTANGNYIPPAGDGGGCVTTGPFGNLTLHFRNFPPVGSISSLPADALDYQPHCLRRNLNSAILANSNNKTNVERLLNEPDIVSFQHRIDSTFYPDGGNVADYGIHAGGHGAVGGDFSDFFASPSDPVFWLHHTMVDKVWTDWQERDPPKRQYATNGTDYLLNDPAGKNVTIEYEVDFGFLDGKWRLGDLMDVSRGPFCYGY